jgi:Fe2+ transport system protein FeoA
MQRERGDARKNPEPPRGPLFVEIRHQSSAIHRHSAKRIAVCVKKPRQN